MSHPGSSRKGSPWGPRALVVGRDGHIHVLQRGVRVAQRDHGDAGIGGLGGKDRGELFDM